LAGALDGNLSGQRLEAIDASVERRRRLLLTSEFLCRGRPELQSDKVPIAIDPFRVRLNTLGGLRVDGRWPLRQRGRDAVNFVLPSLPI